MKKLLVILGLVSTIFTTTVSAAEVPRESVALHLTEDCVVVAENLIADVLTEVQKGLGYSDARAKSNRILFNAWLGDQTKGYSYGDLTIVANNAIFQYRDMYLRPDFYAENVEKVRAVIAPVIEDYKSGKITYAEAEFNARNKIYQSINPNFDPNIEYMKDPIYRDIPPVDNSLFRIARKLLLESK
ncbi:MAG: hypothetical protein E7621_04865 [Ruminococcaceae bacterium]|nr:hypothetical protein [Oscillospiraceae bacterium]